MKKPNEGLWWHDPEFIEGNDYRINKLIGATENMCEITYNQGKSTAEAYYYEIENLSQTPDYNTLMRELMIYIGKYEISFDFWGDNYNGVCITRHDIDVYESTLNPTPADAIQDALDWLNRVNSKKN